MATAFKEVEFIDGIQEFLQSSYITQLYPKNNNTLSLTHTASPESITFSGDVTLFKKQVFDTNDLSLSGAWMLNNEGLESNSIIINPYLKTSKFTYTYVTYKTQSTKPQEGLFSVDYINGILYTSTGLKTATIEYRHSIQYVEGQQMDQLDSKKYSRGTLYTLGFGDNSRIATVYQTPLSNNTILTKESVQGAVLSIMTTGDNSA